ncbi:hypothetical protein LY90DRAFT_499901 [Neocallimastix californiae]|uniref:Zn(2)-C6 fungal-type domain-containing protein n=1 Tax=Neocallimastix californiae TaxID=1754190 RepID=A0A1Y2FF28_9FUNG|nr:hypothetical protein LY90DRAFT_499901 [Neocallimastix californiae]|eukprot:ORY82217.1 hypothetical protein LY90DRAFT_499901 [Neocallimastix californiae]
MNYNSYESGNSSYENNHQSENNNYFYERNPQYENKNLYNTCRKKRRKCTGERPKCLTCQQYNYVCYYNPFPKKRGPQQKRKKRKYKKHEKGSKNDNDSDIMDEANLNEHTSNYNYSVIENIITKNSELTYDFKITPSIFNDFIAYNECINFKDKLNINDNSIIGSELINYIVINYYYKYFHPNFPVINYKSFAVHVKNGTLSKYLLFAMYGMAYLFQPNSNISKATEYIEKSKALILQNYGIVNVQLLQAIFLVTIFESGKSQSWLYSGLGTKIVINNSLYFMNIKKNKYLLKEDIENMKTIALIILGYDTWICLIYKDEVSNEQLRQFIKDRSNLLISLTTKVFSTDYEYYVLCVATFLLEVVHIAQKIKGNDFNIEDIDCLNIDILKTQHYFLKNIDNISLIRFNDISEDFSYYLELSEEQKKWINFFLITIAERIYINRILILDVINDTEKMKIYPIAKSIAIVSKSADDCSIALKLLYEVAELKNNLPLRFSYGKAWAFYQCVVIYILRYVATQESKYIKQEKQGKTQSTKYSIFSSFPQETLAPCYFYLDLLKQMRTYFVNVQVYIREVKLLIYQAEKSVKEKTFQINIRDIFQ